MPFYNSIPFIGKHLKSNALIKELTPTQIAKLGETYQNVIGLGGNAVFAANAFKKLDAQRIEDNIKIPGAVKGPDGVSLVDKTKVFENSLDEQKKAAAAAKNLQTELATALKPTDEYDKAQRKFNENSATFKELVKRIPQGGFGAKDVIGTMKYDVDKARAAIVAQQNLDKQNVAAQFDKEAFKKNLMTTFNIAEGDVDADKKISAIKNSMVKDLASAHKKQLSGFDKTTSDSLNKLHKAAATEIQKMGLLDTIKRANEDNVAILEGIAEKNRQSLQKNANGKTGIGVNINNEQARLSDAQIPDIPQFTSMTGMKIEQNPPGHFKLHFPTFNPRYNQSSKQKPLTDMLLVAQALKAQGYDSIDWKIDIEDPDTFTERAKQAFEASVRAGIPVDNISIRDAKGKEIKAGELYKDEPQALNRLSQRASDIKQELEGLKPAEAESAKNTDVRKAMKEIRAAHLANPPEEEDEEELKEEAEETKGNSRKGPK